jgi:hypothetical protein
MSVALIHKIFEPTCYRAANSRPSAAPSERLNVPGGARARSVMDKWISHFHLDAFRVDATACRQAGLLGRGRLGLHRDSSELG